MGQTSATTGRPDYYAVLGVDAEADDEAIRTAYRALAKQYHPDVADGGQDSSSTERFLEIQDAYDVLGDANRRAQYDIERARHKAQEDPRNWQRDFVGAATAGSGAAAYRPAMPPSRFSRRRRIASVRPYVLGLLLIAAVLGLFFGEQRAKNRTTGQGIVVKVDDPHRAEAEGRLAADMRALSREMDELQRQRAERAEAAKLKAQSPASAAPASPPAPMAPPPVDAKDGKIDCSGEGRSFSVTRQDDGVSISYMGGPGRRPVITDQGLGMIVVSKVEPTNRISIAFMKGDKDRTIVLINDAAGNLYRTFGVECTAAAF